jgi:hypothetical protein
MSLTLTGLVVALIGFIFQQGGVDVAPEKIQTTIEVVMQAVGLITAYIGRFRQGDIKWYGVKK